MWIWLNWLKLVHNSKACKMASGCCWLFSEGGIWSWGSLGHSFGGVLERFFWDFRDFSRVSKDKRAEAGLDKLKPTVISFCFPYFCGKVLASKFID